MHLHLRSHMHLHAHVHMHIHPYAYALYKKDGMLYKKFKCVARVIVGYREDTFQIKWSDAKTFEETAVKIEEVEKELRIEFAKWCLQSNV